MSLRKLKNVIGIVSLKKLRQPLGLVGAEADHGTWLSPRLLERVAHVAHDRLSRCLPEALESSPTLPGRFQARSRVLCTADQLWITHRAIPLKIVYPGFLRIGPSAVSAACASVKNPAMITCAKLPSPAGTDPHTPDELRHRHGQRHEKRVALLGHA